MRSLAWVLMQYDWCPDKKSRLESKDPAMISTKLYIHLSRECSPFTCSICVPSHCLQTEIQSYTAGCHRETNAKYEGKKKEKARYQNICIMFLTSIVKTWRNYVRIKPVGPTPWNKKKNFKVNQIHRWKALSGTLDFSCQSSLKLGFNNSLLQRKFGVLNLLL